MKCRACGLEHSPLVRCEVARRLAQAYTFGTPEPAPTPEKSFSGSRRSAPREQGKGKVSGSSQASSRHGQYADIEARKAYRRDWMRKKRAEARA